MRPILATIHLDALRHNLSVAKLAAPQSKIMAVIKANGYGHGLLRVAAGLHEAHGFAVLSLDEAAALRDAGYQQIILLLEGVFSANELAIASQLKISLVVHCENQIAMLEAATLAQPVSVFAKMNSGMNRLGFTPQDYAAAITRLEQARNVAAEITMMTHFATADEDVGVAAPLAVFNEATQDLYFPTSLANSAALLRYPVSHADWVRPGIMLYGASPVTGVSAASFGLKPVMSLTSEIIAVQTLEIGESVGYGQRFTAARKTRVGIVACGYADGYPRHAPNGTPICVAGKITKTIGRVSMDMLFADLTDMPEANIGSPVELWGAQIPVDAVAEAAGTVGYELLCAVAPRVPVKVAE
jgi:alanine racemase